MSVSVATMLYVARNHYMTAPWLLKGVLLPSHRASPVLRRPLFHAQNKTSRYIGGDFTLRTEECLRRVSSSAHLFWPSFIGPVVAVTLSSLLGPCSYELAAAQQLAHGNTGASCSMATCCHFGAAAVCQRWSACSGPKPTTGVMRPKYWQWRLQPSMNAPWTTGVACENKLRRKDADRLLP
jgi:hypothetical protein